ncbi:MAG TPA: DUF3426 domain-containing protein [Xanthomonadaceae bacterium]|nr:DUF3426 domain-containing protein [Xanthomonadaceae bacterium]
MFVLCPNCQFLVPRDPASGGTPERCPRCDGLLPSVATQPTDSSNDATDSTAREAQAVVVSTPLEADADRPDDTGAIRATASAGRDEALPGPASSMQDPSTPGAVEVDDDAAEPIQVNDRNAAARASTLPSNTVAPDGVAADHIPTPAADARLRSPSSRNSTPAFLDPPAPDSSRRRHGWQALATAALLSLLGMQILLAERARLAADARWRPVLQALCGAIGCRLPAWRQPEEFTMLARDVRMHPQRARALRASVTFRNDARWAQPWPALRLTLSDADGRPLGARTFAPNAYLDTSTRGVLAPGQTARVVIDLHEPGPDVVAFAFEFR